MGMSPNRWWVAAFCPVTIGISWLTFAIAPARAEGERGLALIPRDQFDYVIGVVCGLAALVVAGALVMLARRKKQ